MSPSRDGRSAAKPSRAAPIAAWPVTTVPGSTTNAASGSYSESASRALPSPSKVANRSRTSVGVILAPHLSSQDISPISDYHPRVGWATGVKSDDLIATNGRRPQRPPASYGSELTHDGYARPADRGRLSDAEV